MDGSVSIDFDLKGKFVASPFPVEIVSRRGCDLNPLDLKRDFLKSLSYIWPDQRKRVANFVAAANAMKQRSDDLIVLQMGAIPFLEKELAQLPTRNTLTVVMNSFFLQYPSKVDRDKIRTLIEAAGKTATEESPLVWLRFELNSVLEETEVEKEYTSVVDAIRWPGGHRTLLAKAHYHGSSMEILV